MALLLGMMVSLSVTPFLTLSLGFQSMLLCYAAVAVAGAFFFLVAARTKPQLAVEPEEEVEESFSMNAFRKAARSRDLGLLSAAFFIGVGLFTALATWLEKVLEPFGISIADAGIVGGVFKVRPTNSLLMGPGQRLTACTCHQTDPIFVSLFQFLFRY